MDIFRSFLLTIHYLFNTYSEFIPKNTRLFMKLKNTLTAVLMCVTFATVGCSQPVEQSKLVESTNSANTSSSNSVSNAVETASTESTSLASDATIDTTAGYTKYMMAVDASYPPFTFKDESGTFVGFDIDLMRAIGETQKFKVSVTGVKWSEVFRELMANKYDVVASGVTITPKRQKIIDFTESYMSSYTAFAFTSDSIASVADIKDKKVGVQSGAYYIELLQDKYANLDEFIEFHTIFLSCKDMLMNKVDVCVDDIHILQNMMTEFTNYSDVSHVKYLPAFADEQKQIAFAVNKDNSEMLNKINAGLQQVKANGTYDKIYAKWFGVTDAAQNGS